MSGCCIVRGDRSKLTNIRFGEEFQQLVAKTVLVVEHFGVVDAHIGEDLQRSFERFGRAVESLG